MKLDIRPPYLLIERAAEDWGCTVDDLVAKATAGEIELDTRMHNGEVRRVILRDECERIEATYKAKAKGKPRNRGLREDAKRSYLEVIAFAVANWCGKDNAILRAHGGGGYYEMAAEIERYMALARIPLSRGSKTYANILRDAAMFLRDCGFLAEPEAPTAEDGPQESPQAAPSDAAPKAGATAPAAKDDQPGAASA